MDITKAFGRGLSDFWLLGTRRIPHYPVRSQEDRRAGRNVSQTLAPGAA